MPSNTDICNSAISKLDGNRIIEMSDETPEAELCRANYDMCRDAVLEDVNWTFATTRFQLTTPNAESPIFGFSHAYRIPVDILRVITVNEGPDTAETDWVREGNDILTDVGLLNIIAIKRVTDPELFSPGFVQCLAARLAAEIAIPLTNSKTVRDMMTEEYMAKKLWAQGNDGRQGRARVRRARPFRR